MPRIVAAFAVVDVGETGASSRMTGARSVLRREGGPRRELTKAVLWKEVTLGDKRESSGGGGDADAVVARLWVDAVGVEGVGLIVIEDRPLSVEELVTELTREAASFLVIVTTTQSQVWIKPCPGDGVEAGSARLVIKGRRAVVRKLRKQGRG